MTMRVDLGHGHGPRELGHRRGALGGGGDVVDRGADAGLDRGEDGALDERRLADPDTGSVGGIELLERELEAERRTAEVEQHERRRPDSRPASSGARPRCAARWSPVDRPRSHRRSPRRRRRRRPARPCRAAPRRASPLWEIRTRPTNRASFPAPAVVMAAMLRRRLVKKPSKIAARGALKSRSTVAPAVAGPLPGGGGRSYTRPTVTPLERRRAVATATRALADAGTPASIDAPAVRAALGRCVGSSSATPRT